MRVNVVTAMMVMRPDVVGKFWQMVRYARVGEPVSVGSAVMAGFVCLVVAPDVGW